MATPAAAADAKKEETDLDALLSDDVAAQRAREASEMAAIEEEERRMKELEVRPGPRTCIACCIFCVVLWCVACVDVLCVRCWFVRL